MKGKLLILGGLASFGALYLLTTIKEKKKDCGCGELNASGNLCPCKTCGNEKSMCECDTYEAIQSSVEKFNNWFGNNSYNNANGFQIGDNVYNVKPKRQTIALGASNSGSTSQSVTFFGKQ